MDVPQAQEVAVEVQSRDRNLSSEVK